MASTLPRAGTACYAFITSSRSWPRGARQPTPEPPPTAFRAKGGVRRRLLLSAVLGSFVRPARAIPAIRGRRWLCRSISSDPECLRTRSLPPIRKAPGLPTAVLRVGLVCCVEGGETYLLVTRTTGGLAASLKTRICRSSIIYKSVRALNQERRRQMWDKAMHDD
jgi:hypothetical protein